MKCLCKYDWIKLPRAVIPNGKGIMGAWMKLASRAAFRKGIGFYCGHHNAVEPGMWKGGIVGLKSILGVRRRPKALYYLNALQGLGYIQYSLDPKNKKLTYSTMDWVVKCSGKPCEDGSVYYPDRYFLNPAYDILKLVYFFNAAKGQLEAMDYPLYQGPLVNYIMVMHREDLSILQMYPDLMKLEGVEVRAYRLTENT